MGWDQAGNYNRVHNFSADASAGIKILASRMDAEINDIASAFTRVWTRDGQNTPTTDLPLGGRRFVNVGAPTSVSQFLRVREMIESIPIFMQDAESSADRISVSAQYFTSVSANQAPGDGTRILVRANSNKSSAVLYLNGHSANIEFQDGNRAAAAMVSGGIYELIFSSVDVAWKQTSPDDGRTAAEIAAGVTPLSYQYEPGERARYNTLADAVAVSATHELQLREPESISAAITLPAGAMIRGHNRPLITCTANGVHVFNATSVASITIDGVRFKGNSASTVPSSGFGGFSAANNGLVTITTCTDVRVTNCEFDTFYNGLTIQNCDRVYCNFNRCRNWYFAGIVGSYSTYGEYDHNTITESAQTGAAVAYGVIVTGDEAGGNTQERCSISFNNIDGVPSWDGIMSHDATGLRIIGNDIRNVRNGIDLGHLAATNEVRNLTVSNNYIKSTTTDSWATAAASHFGIAVSGYDATDRVLGATINNNIVDGFFATAGMVGSGNNSHIVVSNADDVAISGNVVKNGGNVITNSGVYMTGTVNRCAVNGNTLQGAMAGGAIRGASLTSDVLAIGANVIKQTTTTDSAIEFSASTISQLALGRNASNSSAHYVPGASTITVSGEELEGSATYDPPSLADGAGTTTTVTVTGAALGDFAVASFGADTSGITINAWVSSANTVSVRFQNESGGTLDIGSSTLRARVIKRH